MALITQQYNKTSHNHQEPADLQSPAAQFALFQLLATELHKGANFRFFFTKDGDPYIDKEGNEQTARCSFYVPGDKPFTMPAHWHERNPYFGVNGVGNARPTYQAGRTEDVTAVNALLAEFDGKDFIVEAEWQPFYVLPDLAGLSDAKKRGALTKANTAAIDAAYKANPEAYKARALAHIRQLTPRPSALWDSGGGYQCVWLLAETIAVDDSNRAEVAKLQRGWSAFVDGDRAASDLRRLLRVPGSHNYKPKYAPNFPLVAFLWCDLDCRYNVDDLAALLPAETPKTPAKAIHIPAGVELAPVAPFTLPKHPAIDAYNQATNLHDLLLSLGYTDAGDKRMSRPGADSAGLELNSDNTATIYSTADPLYCGHRITPAHVLCTYTHAGDVDALLDQLAPEVRKLLAAMRNFVRRAEFAAKVPWVLQAANGYRTNDRDRRVADALLDLASAKYNLSFMASLGAIANAAGVGISTARRAIAALTGWFVTVQEAAKDAKDHRSTYTLLASCVLDRGSAVNADTPITYATTLPLTTHKAKDAFTRSLTNVPDLDEYQADRAVRDLPPVTDAQLLPGKILRRRLEATLPSAGPAVLLAIDALEEYGGTLTKQALGVLIHKTPAAISRICKRLELLDLASIERRSVTLHNTWRGIIDTITPEMPTYGAADRREDSRLAQQIRGVSERLEVTKDDRGRQKLQHIIMLMVNERMKLQQRIGPKEALDRLDGASLYEVCLHSGRSTWWDFEDAKNRKRNNTPLWFERPEMAALREDYNLDEMTIIRDLGDYRQEAYA